MKKIFLTSLASLIVLPVTTSLTANYKSETKIENSIKKISSNNLKNPLTTSDNSGYDWNNIQSLLNNGWKNNWITSHFNPSQLNTMKQKSQERVNQLNASNASASTAFTSFLNESSQFNDIYQNNQNAFTNIKQKIDAQFFNLQKIDLNLDGSNTYADAINSLNILINSLYPGNNITVSLTDNKIAHNYLFDDSSAKTLADFINDNISIKVNIQFGNLTQETKTIKLKNIKINSETEDSWLYECITSYFNNLTPQDLNLTATNNRYDALNSIINKINQRFGINITSDSSTSKINISLVDTGVAKDNFMQPQNINAVMNQTMHFDVKISDNTDAAPKITTQPLYLTNINFNFTNMKTTINNLWLNNNSKSNPLDLNLISDQTYGTVVSNFNQRMENLNQKDHFQIKLTDSSANNVKIDNNYDPRNPVFKANVEFGYLKNNSFQSLGTSDVYLSNVKLSQQDQKLVQKYNDLISLRNKLDVISTALNAISLTTSILALTSPFFAPELTPKLSYTAIISSVGAISLGIYLTTMGEVISSTDLIADVFTIVSVTVSLAVVLLTTLLASFGEDVEILAIADIFFGVISLITSTIADAKDWLNL